MLPGVVGIETRTVLREVLRLTRTRRRTADGSLPPAVALAAASPAVRPARPPVETPLVALAPLQVQVIAYTHFEPPADVPW